MGSLIPAQELGNFKSDFLFRNYAGSFRARSEAATYACLLLGERWRNRMSCATVLLLRSSDAVPPAERRRLGTVMLRSSIVRLVELCTRHAWPVIVLAVALAPFCRFYPARHFPRAPHIEPPFPAQ